MFRISEEEFEEYARQHTKADFNTDESRKQIHIAKRLEDIGFRLEMSLDYYSIYPNRHSDVANIEKIFCNAKDFFDYINQCAKVFKGQEEWVAELEAPVDLEIFGTPDLKLIDTSFILCGYVPCEFRDWLLGYKNYKLYYDSDGSRGGFLGHGCSPLDLKDYLESSYSDRYRVYHTIGLEHDKLSESLKGLIIQINLKEEETEGLHELFTFSRLKGDNAMDLVGENIASGRKLDYSV